MSKQAEADERIPEQRREEERKLLQRLFRPRQSEIGIDEKGRLWVKKPFHADIQWTKSQS